jgi:hypothetical protein
VVLQRRCLVYLTIVHRKRGEVEETRRLIPRSLAVATGRQAFEYDGNAKANQAWVAWREDNLGQARLNGLAALALWRPSVTQPFKWLALWPLIGVAMAEDQLSEAVAYAQTLLEPHQQPMPEELTTAVEDAIQAWAEGEPELARTHLGRALELAQEMRYL